MAHRGHNEGSIYKRKDGRWVGQVQTGFKPDGKRKFTCFYGKTRKEVADKIASTTNDISKNLFVEPSKITLEDWLWGWMLKYKKDYVRTSTYVRYNSLIKLHIVPEIGMIKLKDLRSSHIQQVYNNCVKKDLSVSAIKHIHTVFNQSLEQAICEGMIFSNPALHTVRPKKPKKEVMVLTEKQQERLVMHLENNTIGVIIKLAISTGARAGEILALRWKNIDFEKKTLSIENGMVPVYNFGEDGKEAHYTGRHRIAELKTSASRRVIPLTDGIIRILKEYKLNQRSYIKRMPSNVDIFPDMVFLNEAGNYIDINSLRRQYARILKELKIPYIKFHALRHTFATRILEKNVHPKVAQELLGHTSCSVTLDIYSHVLPSQKREAIDKIEGIV